MIYKIHLDNSVTIDLELDWRMNKIDIFGHTLTFPTIKDLDDLVQKLNEARIHLQYDKKG